MNLGSQRLSTSTQDDDRLLDHHHVTIDNAAHTFLIFSMSSTTGQPITGSNIVAQTLKDLGVTVIFGIVGVPVSEVAERAIDIGIKFIGFRNEQAASYAATAYGYLTGKPGVCLVVGGPGVLHAIAGVRPVSYFFSARTHVDDVFN